jgi:UDP:flavonoid glycosyltransferase YjiC (YdhE family)
MALLTAAKAFMRAVGIVYWAGARTALEAFKPDVVVLSTLAGFYHSSLCEALRVRCMVAHFCPLVPTGAWAPPIGLPFDSAPFAGINRWLWRVTTKMGWAMMYRDTVNELRASAGLEALADAGGPYLSLLSDRPTLLFYSAVLRAPPEDYPSTAHVLGAPVAATEAAFEPPAALAAFLAGGSGPVVAITLGSMASVQDDGNSARGGRSAAAVLRLCADAAVAAGARALVFTDGASAAEVAFAGCGSDVMPLQGSVPHAWLLPRCAALVCHGGSGTVHAALRAGTPALVCAVDTSASDQAFWGGRLVAARLAPATFTAASVKQPALAAALRTCINDAPMRARAQAAAQAVAKENAAADAAAIILKEARS